MAAPSHDPEPSAFLPIERYVEFSRQIKASIGKEKLLVIEKCDGETLRLFPQEVKTTPVKDLGEYEVVIGVAFNDKDAAIGWKGVVLIQIQDLKIEDMQGE